MIDYDESEKESANDFHVAEVNLVECLVRTNILDRISYIITTLNPNPVTVYSCLKILIRLARSGRDVAMKILDEVNMMKKIVEDFRSAVEGTGEPQFIVLKLMRVLMAYDIGTCKKVKELGVIEVVKKIIATREDMKVIVLKLQIESFRYMRLYLKFCSDESTYNDLMSPIRYLLEWHYQHLNYQQDNHFIIRQHASSLIYLVGSGNFIINSKFFTEIFKRCCCKWFAMAERHGAREFSQKVLLSTLLDVGAGFVKYAADQFYDFVDKYLLKFLNSTHYQTIMSELISSSPLLRSGYDRCNAHRPLINLGSIVRKNKKSPPKLILSQDYSVYLLSSLQLFIVSYDSQSHNKNIDYYRKLGDVFYGTAIEGYLNEFTTKRFNRAVCTNWFLKTEIDFVFNLIESKWLAFYDQVLKVSFTLLSCLTHENYDKIVKILANYILCGRHLREITPISKEEYHIWRCVYISEVDGKMDDHVGVSRRVYLLN